MLKKILKGHFRNNIHGNDTFRLRPASGSISSKVCIPRRNRRKCHHCCLYFFSITPRVWTTPLAKLVPEVTDQLIDIYRHSYSRGGAKRKKEWGSSGKHSLAPPPRFPKGIMANHWQKHMKSASIAWLTIGHQKLWHAPTAHFVTFGLFLAPIEHHALTHSLTRLDTIFRKYLPRTATNFHSCLTCWSSYLSLSLSRFEFVRTSSWHEHDILRKRIFKWCHEMWQTFPISHYVACFLVRPRNAFNRERSVDV